MPSQTIAPARVNPILLHPQERRVGLSGEWSFRLDPEERGLQSEWFNDLSSLTDRIQVPGCWQGQGFGGEAKETVWDFRLEARTYRATYTGTGWYGKGFRVPNQWKGLRVWMNFGGVHPSAEVWLNGAGLGKNDLPFVPFGFDITDLLSFDDENQLVVRVHEENRILGLAFNWQGNWSGLYRGVDLTATGSAYLEHLAVNPDVDHQCLRIQAHLGQYAPSERPLTLGVSVQPVVPSASPIFKEVEAAGEVVEFSMPVPSPLLWSPDAPNLYRVDATLMQEGEVLDALSERTGFVKLSTEGKHFLINGEPYYMRGSGDFVSCPETGCPDTDRERWRRKLVTLRDYGYNYVRCQSYVYAPEYFDVADEVGLLVQSEMGMLGGWGGSTPWHVYGWPKPTPAYRHALKRHWDLIVKRDVNHPSANIYCMSNELGTETEFPRIAWQCYRDTKSIKPSAFVIWTDGGYSESLPGDFVNAEAETDATCDKPLVQHEFRWWSSFPDVESMHKYTGAIRPYAAEIALAAAESHGISHVLPQAAANSKRLQLLEAKGKMERCRRDHPHLAGICHFNAMDANPSPQGVVDEFYDRKCADRPTWLQTNGDTVVLSSLGFEGRVIASGGVLGCDLFVSDFSHPPFQSPGLEWCLTMEGAEVGSGLVEYSHQPFRTCFAGTMKVAVPEVVRPVRAQLLVRLSEGDRCCMNQWDLWFFPEEVTLPSSVRLFGELEHTWLRTVDGMKRATRSDLEEPETLRLLLTERLDDDLVSFVRAGGRVLLATSETLVRPFPPKLGLSVGRYFFTPPANYPPYEDGHDGTIIQQHAMLGDLPHEGFADLQFYRMMGESPPIDLEPLALNGGDPVIRVMHSYPVCRPLAYLVEGALGAGLLIVCALDLDQSWPEARYLLAQICNYAVTQEIRPSMTLSEEAAACIVAATSLP